MLFLTILALSFGASVKATLQSNFGKHNVKTFDDSVYFNCLIFVFSSAVSALFGNLLGINLKTILAGFTFGVASVIFQLIYLKTMTNGPVSMTVMFSNFGMIIPMLVSVLFFDEKLTGIKIIGLLLVILSMILNAVLKEDKKATGKWLIYAFLTFLTSGTMVTVQKIASSALTKSETGNFVAIAYAFSTLISIMIYFFRKRFMNGKRTYKSGISTLVTAFAIGAILSIVQVFLTRSIEKFGALILLPGYNCGTVLMVFVIGLVLYKEKHSMMRWISALLGIVAIVLLSI